MLASVNAIFAVSSFLPHGRCYLWQPGLIGLHIFANLLMALTYYAIAIALIYLIQKRQDTHYSWMFLLFSAFIIAGATTHAIEVWVLWHPIYWISGTLKAISALISLGTAIKLIPLLPKILQFPSPAQLEAINQALEQRILKHQQTEQALKESEERWQLALRGNNDGIWDWNVKTNAVFFSTRWKEMLGYQDCEIAHHLDAWTQLVHPDDLERVMQTLQAHFDRETPFYLSEHRILCKNGTYKWVLDRGQALWDEQDNIVRMVGSHTDISDRKQVEDELRWQETLLRSMADASPLAFYVVDNRSDEILYLNHRFCQIWGIEHLEAAMQRGELKNNEIIPDCLSQLVDVPAFAESCKLLQTEENRDMIEDEIPFTQGRTIRRFSAQIRGEGDRYFGRLYLFEDISDRKKAEAALKESEIRFQAFMDNSPAAAWITNESGRILYLNPAYYRQFNVPNSYQPGKTDLSFFPAELRQEYLKNTRQVINSKQTLEVIEQGVRRDGSPGEFLVYKFPIPTTTGQLLVGGVAIDITERKKAEAEVKAQQQFLRQVIDVVPSAIFVKDRQGYFLIANKVSAQMHGTVPERMINKREHEFNPNFDPVHLEQYLATNRAVMETRQPQTLTQEIMTAQGEMRWYKTVISPFIDAQDCVQGIIGTSTDITELKNVETALRQAKERAESANRAKSQFLSNMSHELRTPLNAILGFSQVLSRSNCLDNEQQEQLKIINRSGEHLLNLINDILSMAKIEAGQITLNLHCFHLPLFLDDIERMLQLKASEKGLQLIVERSPNLPSNVLADENKLRQILVNLLANAIKFTSAGSVRLGVSCTPQHKERLALHFKITDTGPGIAPSEMDLLFDPFVQTTVGRQSMQGTGLGLPISREFVRLMGGEIEVDSHLAQGTTFRFNIDLSETASASCKPWPTHRRVIGLEPNQPPYRILVVEDADESRLLLLQLLQPLGFQVQQAVNGQEAVKLSSSWKPHLIWMDIRMPVMDGYEATRQIKAASQGWSTIVIALTASAFEEERCQIIAAGCDDFVYKPFQESVLFDKMAEYLGVRYIYEEENSAPCELSGLSRKLTAEDFSTMSPEWIANLHHATLCARESQILQLVEQIPESERFLAQALKDLVNNFRLDLIIDLTQSPIHE
ncbi:MAG: PAS domain S-box protein [Desertifilum sp. SIO1I2]|nr:PAS domain S-box protein [Desertifilum sp. SIO1I2]